MTPLQIARRQYNVAEKRHAAAQICGRYDMSPRQTLRMARAAENLRKWAGALRRAEQDHENAKRWAKDARFEMPAGYRCGNAGCECSQRSTVTTHYRDGV